MRRREPRLTSAGPPATRSKSRASLASAAAVSVLWPLAVVAGLATGSPSAVGAPGSPGTPGAPDSLYEETFENAAPASNLLLTDYVGASGQRYTAEYPWSNRAACNGLIIDWNSTWQTGDCAGVNGAQAPGSQWFVRLQQLIYGLGVVEESADPATNAGAASFTANPDPGPNKIQFKTATDLALPAAGRFVTFSVDAVATSCGAAHPLLRFYLVDGGVERPVSSSPIDPCNQGEPINVPAKGDAGATTIRGGRFTANGNYLIMDDTLGIVLRNEQGSAAGNDGAYDNIRVLDVTPQLDKTFSPTSVEVGGVTTLRLTVTNTSELGAKSGWQFTDTLPDGLRVADLPNARMDCGGTTSVDWSFRTINVRAGELAPDQASCSVWIDVTSDTPSGAQPSPKTYRNCAENISEVIGVDLPSCASVAFYSEPRLTIDKTSDATASTRAGDLVTYTITATNTGTGDYLPGNPALLTDDLSGVLDDATYRDDADADRPGTLSFDSPRLSWRGALAVGESVTVTYTVRLRADGDGRVRNVAFEGDGATPACDPPDPGGIDPQTGVACDESEHLLPRLSITKTADTNSLPIAGGVVRYTVTVRNVGPGDYTADAPATMTDDLSNVLDDATYNNDAVASSGSASYSEPIVSWTGALAADQASTITYSVTYTAADEGDHVLTNSACVDPSQAAGPSCDTWQVPGAHLEAWKTADPAEGTTVRAGDSITYTLHFASDGRTAATVTAEDDLTDVLDDATVTQEPTASNPGLTAARTEGALVVTGTVPAGETYSVSYTVTVDQDGQRGNGDLGNVMTVVGACDEPDPDCATHHPVVDYAKSVEASATPVVAGTLLTYIVSITNESDRAATISTTDDLSGVLDDASLVAGPTSDTASVTVAGPSDGVLTMAGTLSPATTATVSYTVRVNPYGQRGDNSADNFLAGATDCDTDESTCTPLPDIAASKDSDPASGLTVLADDRVAYTLTFTNTGKAPGPVDHVDHLTRALDDAALTAGPVSSNPAVTVVLDDDLMRFDGTLDPGDTVTVTYTMTVRPDGDRGDNLIANVVARPGEEAVCDTGRTNCTEHPVPQILSSKSVTPGDDTVIRAGRLLTYTLTFQNIGAAAGEVDRLDDLIHVLDDARVVSEPVSSNADWRVRRHGTRIRITGTADVGQTVTVTYRVRVRDDADRGDSVVANYLLSPGEQAPARPVCDVPDSHCTRSQVLGRDAFPPLPGAPQLPQTGSSFTPAAIGAAAGLMLLGFAMVLLGGRTGSRLQ